MLGTCTYSYMEQLLKPALTFALPQPETLHQPAQATWRQLVRLTHLQLRPPPPKPSPKLV